jgi:putative addiction module antidote
LRKGAPAIQYYFWFNKGAFMAAHRITQIGNSLGLILPKKILARLKLEKGDAVSVTDTPDGVAITPYNAEFETQMDAARTIMKARRNALRGLAK